MKVLITGGAGYIGSTIASALLDHGHVPVLLDSLVTGPAAFTHGRIFYQGDIADKALLERIFKEHPEIQATVHCAALIVVPESVAEPYRYYHENVCKSLELFNHLERLGYPRVVFSSSASIYDAVPGFKVTEEAPLKPGSPYARTKYMMEMVLQDLSRATRLRGIALRYFNPIGADPKLRSGIHAREPSHVLGKLVDTALGKLPEFQITGVDWPTRDGSGIRDYIHVWDLAMAHLKAVEQFDQVLAKVHDTYAVINLGTGTGVTVKELVAAFERVYGQTIPKREAPPRPGDVAGAYANADRAWELLGWKAEHSIDDGIRSALEWGQRRKAILGYA
ncbi:UDP-glucose 4-epimerase GalE [Meiothermus granaticius]|uniref:UDP-glucose 4-epimerase n=1 Tax=Meiothermus granaticius NBRC 107808 TaxID=1227551 RepID=A0A399F9D6_9DEIN|nr:UDP-glucose 4-epimerase GalE [Meiothermus granaticius]MCL6526644.1 UDP-glucose 4-epimerase GalE [Thermaceae bacterium]RIH92305.1 UDP-glucose 4-epimerase [Meiothermus granaticius NBRC 107808]GEM88043.1 UDP-glucose 4-epimerase [Meiothermus granaticius NBRC 107808]